MNDLMLGSEVKPLSDSLLSPENYKHYMAVATEFSKTDFVPAKLKNKPADMLICMELGFQVGLSPLQSIQSIAVINGMPSLYGDALLAVIQAHKDYEYIKEYFEGEGDNKKAICIIKRRNHEPHISEFSVDDAKKAKLWGKAGPWTEYSSRMLRWRARGFCARDTFADALKGIKSREELEDYEQIIPKNKVVEQELMDIVNESNANPVDIEDGVIIHPSESGLSEGIIESIHGLLAVKGVNNERTIKLLSAYGVDKVSDLTEEQANHVITRLGKLEDV